MSAPPTNEERAEWARLAAAATEGPWFAWENPTCWTVQTPTDTIANLAIRVRAPKSLHPEANAAFIAAARTAVPRLEEALAGAERRAERAEALLEMAIGVSDGLRAAVRRIAMNPPAHPPGHVTGSGRPCLCRWCELWRAAGITEAVPGGVTRPARMITVEGGAGEEMAADEARCGFCGRKHLTHPARRAENPYCNECLVERLAGTPPNLEALFAEYEQDLSPPPEKKP